jgi:hypothetical protein
MAKIEGKEIREEKASMKIKYWLSSSRQRQTHVLAPPSIRPRASALPHQFGALADFASS